MNTLIKLNIAEVSSFLYQTCWNRPVMSHQWTLNIFFKNPGMGSMIINTQKIYSLLHNNKVRRKNQVFWTRLDSFGHLSLISDPHITSYIFFFISLLSLNRLDTEQSAHLHLKKLMNTFNSTSSTGWNENVNENPDKIGSEMRMLICDFFFFLSAYTSKTINDLAHDKTYKMACAPSEDRYV